MIKVIKFWAGFCGPCTVYAPVFDKVLEELKDQVEFVNVDIENDTTGLTREYKVTGIPTTVVIKDGETKIKTGRISKEELKQFILN